MSGAWAAAVVGWSLLLLALIGLVVCWRKARAGWQRITAHGRADATSTATSQSGVEFGGVHLHVGGSHHEQRIDAVAGDLCRQLGLDADRDGPRIVEILTAADAARSESPALGLGAGYDDDQLNDDDGGYDLDHIEQQLYDFFDASRDDDDGLRGGVLSNLHRDRAGAVRDTRSALRPGGDGRDGHRSAGPVAGREDRPLNGHHRD